MPRRNYLLIFGAIVLALLCYRAADPMARSFSDAASAIQRRYVDRVDRQSLWSSAIQGMIHGLDDPYSEYIDPQDASELESTLDQKFAGIGIQVGPEPHSGRPQVISPIVGSPAYKAGILAGDVIVEIDGQPTRNMKYSDATARIRGKIGETVSLKVERAGATAPIELPPIGREIINVESVLGDRRGAKDDWDFLLTKHPNIGYVRITNFGERTADELKASLTQLKSQGMQALILDLRDNPGGLLRPAAVGVCDLFLAEGKPIVSVRGRNGDVEQSYVAGGGEKFVDFPMVVLLNRYSASASEIVSACLQDNNRATIIGERSYGKGTVQNLIPLENQGVLKLTTAAYARPSGKNIQRRQAEGDTGTWGVEPEADGKVEMTKDDQQAWAKWRRNRDVVHGEHANSSDAASAAKENESDWQEHDAPLRRAVEFLDARLKTNSSG
jgi:carboxyl-terminal processing protease